MYAALTDMQTDIYSAVNDKDVTEDPTNRREYTGIAPDPRALVAGTELIETSANRPAKEPGEAVLRGTQGTTGLGPAWIETVNTTREFRTPATGSSDGTVRTSKRAVFVKNPRPRKDFRGSLSGEDVEGPP